MFFLNVLRFLLTSNTEGGCDDIYKLDGQGKLDPLLVQSLS